MKRIRLRRLAKLAAVCIGLFLVLGVWVSHQFPALTHGPKSSVELLEGLFTTPTQAVEDVSQYVLTHAELKGAELFVQSCDLPADCESRLMAMLRGERFQEVTVPFVYTLYELYGAPVTEPEAISDLAYPEGGEPAPSVAAGVGLSTLVRESKALRKHVVVALQVFDALFLQVKPGALDQGLPLRERYDAASYERLKALVRQAADEHLQPLDATPGPKAEASEYQAMLEEILADDERLDAFVESLTDFIRQQSDSWLQSFLLRERRKATRIAWAKDCIANNRLYEIADYARERATRRLAVHIVVDGLQGKLLEGLVQLSSGDAERSGARYVRERVRSLQSEAMDPARYDSGMPSGIGNDLTKLADDAPKWPAYLKNFRTRIFGAEARAVTVNVATVETPTLSVRNLQGVQSGHTVAGPFGTGIPNFSYVDRRTQRGRYFWGSDVLYLEQIFSNRENEIPGGVPRNGPGARTLFQRLRGYNTLSCMASVDTGAVENLSAVVGLAVGPLDHDFIEKALILRLRSRARMETQLDKRRRSLADHRTLSHSFLGSLVFDALDIKRFHEYALFLAENEDKGLPDYLLWYSPWVDHYAHAEGPFSDAIIGRKGEVDRLDFFLGKILDAYESAKTADGGVPCADRTLFGLVSDHGLAYTPRLVSTEALLFEGMRKDGIDLVCWKMTADEGGLPLIRGPKGGVVPAGCDAAVGSTASGSYVIDVFADPPLRHPGYHELRAHALHSGQTIDWIEQLQTRLKGVVDFAIVREYGPSAGQAWPSGVESV
ncbi:alkaline phosphatase family protein, partial [bacterium]|nr:alkaline phosphatase family protein [bacterium]